MKTALNAIFLLFLICYQLDAADMTFFVGEKTSGGGLQIKLPKEPIPLFFDEKIFEATKRLALKQPSELLDNIYFSYVAIRASLSECHSILGQTDEQESSAILSHYTQLSREAHKIILKNSALNPLCFLWECSGKLCPFARKANSKKCPRASIENQILAALNEYGDDLNLVFYASGECFFETLLSLKLGARVKSIVLIDPQMELGINQICSLLTLGQNIIDTKIILDCQIQGRKLGYQLAQILHFLGHENPHLRLFVYGSHRKFLDDVENGVALKASAIIAMDYQSDPTCLDEKLESEISELFAYSLASRGVLLAARSKIIDDNKLGVVIHSKIKRSSSEKSNFLGGKPDTR